MTPWRRIRGVEWLWYGRINWFPFMKLFYEMSFIDLKYQNWDIYHIYNIPWSWKSCFTLILNLPALSGLYKVWKKRKPKSLSQNFAFGSLIDSGNNTPVKKTWETFQQYVHSVYYTNRKLGIFIDLVPTSTAPSKGRTISCTAVKALVWNYGT